MVRKINKNKLSIKRNKRSSFKNKKRTVKKRTVKRKKKRTLKGGSLTPQELRYQIDNLNKPIDELLEDKVEDELPKEKVEGEKPKDEINSNIILTMTAILSFIVGGGSGYGISLL